MNLWDGVEAKGFLIFNGNIGDKLYFYQHAAQNDKNNAQLIKSHTQLESNCVINFQSF